MQPGSDFGSQYYAHHYPPSHPNPNPVTDPIQPAYASAPPYSNYSSPEFPVFSSSLSSAAVGPHPPLSQNPDPISSAPSPQYPSYAPYSSTTIQPEQPPVSASAPYSHLQHSSSATYFPYDSQNYGAPPNPNPSHSTNPNPPFSSAYAAYENTYEEGFSKFDRGDKYYSEGSGKYGTNASGSYGQGWPGNDQDWQERSTDKGIQYGHVGLQDDGFGDGVYAYDGGKEPYGARGTLPKTSSPSAWGSFDDYGRSTTSSSGGNDHGGSAGKIVRAVPKAEVQQDVKNGVQKFRVKLLPEGTSVNTIDVLCQIGLDGIRMLDPSNYRTLRIYPLESVTRWEVLDSSIFCFWSKSSVDVEPKRIRLKSNNYTTNTILDTVTAASVQLKEMGSNSVVQNKGSGNAGKPSEQPNEKKKGFADWMNLMKPGNEEKEHWVPDEAVSQCTSCGVAFGPFVRRHHCRNCGDIFCDKCSQGRIALTADENAQLVRVCDGCMAEVTQRLNNAKDTSSRSSVVQSHEDLARKLQEEMERNLKSSSGSKSSDSSGRRMREVACPTCTVHLQVQVPISGSETIECGVCQHPFLVSAH
ncbi:1-phosphatidylinositol-3-phosphate 5-kinase FAB1B [Apostasia shenzhenica]|uniref:1-phosphatidylinositol-3-phosphate 5-kinase FAB1B n=1 Tax=Apostasia shenzhenica TaxID=1088818 RepID=A0A2I0BF02_9ASPA|nr:1-phosphatidylinositol-3-phosphate 5-kinase FAB1B [Apostasia shenzhenica]